MNLSPESITLCNAGPFEVDALVAFLPALTKEIAEHGERTVVERCQIARVNCATDGFAVECVKSYFATHAEALVMSEMARKAMTDSERVEASKTAMDAMLRVVKAPTLKVSVS